MGRQLPVFSIVIPTYARPRQLVTCLRSLERSSYPANQFEVIVVDDGSEMPPETAVAAFRNRLNVTLLTQQHAGPAAARNTGAARAKGRVLVFTDDDCTPAPDWLEALARRSATAPDCAVGGQTVNALPDNPYSAASQMLIDYLYTYYNADPSQAFLFTSNNLALPTDRFHAIGGFDTTFPRAAGEDRELCDRWHHYGYRMIYAPEMVVYHSHKLTLRTFCRQHFNYGRAASHFHDVRARRYHGQIRIEPASFYLNMLRYPLAHTQRRRALLFAALLLTTQAANASGFFWERVNRSHRSLVREYSKKEA
jgi:GT2 family glycosyltransferase